IVKKGPRWSRGVLAAIACMVPAALSCESRQGHPIPTAETTGASAAAAPSASTPSGGEPRRVALEEKAMGTRVTIVAFTSDAMPESVLKPKLDTALAEIRRLEAVMTTWRDDSEISRINAAAGKEAVRVGQDTFLVIQKSLWISRASGGVFDITFASMGGVWKFDDIPATRVPSKEEVEQGRKRIDWHKIELDDGARTVRLTAPTTRINL